ncbi:MAG: NAD-dependent epimerase/dehydratase family protein [Verrucomicrobia bacterium]|nr:NAD-dependent epimerase/dehydratase family protein [Verrucomicrobiota bacterium]
MAYLVTGGCGFIGSHLVEALVAAGEPVRILDNLSSGYERNIEPFRDRIEFQQGDVRDIGALTAAMDGVRYVFHEAALVSVFDSVERPRDNHDINLTGTINVLEAARAAGAQRVVVASSAAIYGNDPELPKTESMRPVPESPYALAKITKEYYMRVYAALYGLETVSLRYFNVYGPRQDPSSMYSGVISKFCEVYNSSGTPQVFGDGLQTRDFVFVKDVVDANLRAMRTPGIGNGEPMNVATGQRTSLLDLLRHLSELTGHRVDPIFKDARVGDVKHSVADVSRARERMNFEAGFSLRQGLQALLESLQSP